jgi:hypothetical protein
MQSRSLNGKDMSFHAVQRNSLTTDRWEDFTVLGEVCLTARMMYIFHLVRSTLPLGLQRNLRGRLTRGYIANTQQTVGMLAVWEANDEGPIAVGETYLDNIISNDPDARLKNDCAGLKPIDSHLLRQRETLKDRTRGRLNIIMSGGVSIAGLS